MADTRMILEKAAWARSQMKRLCASPDYRARFAKGEPQAVEAYRQLSEDQAAGLAIRDEALHGTDVNFTSQQAAAYDQSVAAMVNDPLFRKSFAKGDPDALRQWRQVVVDGGADLIGVTQAENMGARPAPSPQPEPGSVGAVTARAPASAWSVTSSARRNPRWNPCRRGTPRPMRCRTTQRQSESAGRSMATARRPRCSQAPVACRASSQERGP